MRVAVVGAGIHGVSSARTLAERGHDVTLFDQFGAGNVLGSSHGRSRIVRKAYEDAFYTEIMTEAYPLWPDLDRASGRIILHEVGLLYFGRQASRDLQAVMSGLSGLNVLHEVLSPRESAQVFPQLHLGHGEVGIFTPEAGWVDADAAVQATFDLAMKSGCHYVVKKAWDKDLAGYDKVAICPGAWVQEWLPDVPACVNLQTVAYVRGENTGPVWIEDGPNWLYGFPASRENSGDRSFKVAAHKLGRAIDPNQELRTPVKQDLEAVKELARRRFGIQQPVVTESLGCLYTNLPNDDFQFHRLTENRLVVSACSGHGFKFGPWVGTVVADWAEGRPARFERLWH